MGTVHVVSFILITCLSTSVLVDLCSKHALLIMNTTHPPGVGLGIGPCPLADQSEVIMIKVF